MRQSLVYQRYRIPGFQFGINAIYSSINFTVETEEDNSLPFLDVKLTKCEGRIEFDIYRKPISIQGFAIPGN
jgi:hypothetical protein